MISVEKLITIGQSGLSDLWRVCRNCGEIDWITNYVTLCEYCSENCTFGEDEENIEDPHEIEEWADRHLHKVEYIELN